MISTEGQMLKTRVKTAVVIVLVAIPIFIFAETPYVMSTLGAILSLAAVYEIYHAYEELKQFALIAVSCAAAVVFPYLHFDAYTTVLGIALPLFAALFLIRMARMDAPVRYTKLKSLTETVAIALFFASFSYMILLEHGKLYFMMTVFVCAVSDVFQYFAGRRFGRAKMAPEVSPHKTVEGAFGGIVGAVLVALLFSALVFAATGTAANVPGVVIYAILASEVGMVGDLSMSVIKRLNGVKDYSNLLPGHGGILDRFDSQLLVAPFTLLFVMYVNPLFV